MYQFLKLEIHNRAKEVAGRKSFGTIRSIQNTLYSEYLL